MVCGTFQDIHAFSVNNVLIKFKDINSQVKAEALSDADGNYCVVLPKDVYTATATAVGYLPISQSVNVATPADTALNFTIANGFALIDNLAWAGEGKRIISGGYINTTEFDFVLENERITMAIADESFDAQIGYSKGLPLDLLVKGIDLDQLDWIRFLKMAYSNETGDDWWINTILRVDTIYVTTNTAPFSQIRTEARIFRIDDGTPIGANEVLEIHDGQALVFRTDVEVISDFSIEPNTDYVFAKSIIVNKGSDNLNLWVGDVIDYDGTGQTTYAPGVNIGGVGAYTPDAPWFANYGEFLTYGAIYQGAMAQDFQIYGTTFWLGTKKEINLASLDTFTMERYIIARNPDGFSVGWEAVEDTYFDLQFGENGFFYEVTHTDSYIEIGETIEVTVEVKNLSPDSVYNDLRVKILPAYNTSLVGDQEQIINLGSVDSSEVQFQLLGNSGGKSWAVVEIDPGFGVFTERFPIFMEGPGWYAGDNHTHSTFSDGVGTIEQNVASARFKGMAFMTATDHNTINQASAVDVQNDLHEDIIVMTGEEVTTFDGHSLAYNTGGVLIPWNLNQYTHQELIDITNNTSSPYGSGFMYIAHPNYDGLSWDDLSLTDYTGLEVWNGFSPPNVDIGPSNNEITFQEWDVLNQMGRRLLGISNSDGHNPSKIADNFIVAYLDTFSKQNIIDVMRDNGHYYGSNGPVLDFKLSFIDSTAVMGSTLTIPFGGDEIEIDIMGYSYSLRNKIEELRLIKNGNILQTWSPDEFQVNYLVNDQAEEGDFYRIEMETENGGFAYSNPIWIREGVVSTKNIGINTGVTVYPNPVQNILHIDFDKKETSVSSYQIFSLEGVLMQSGTLQAKTNQLAITDLAAGIYLLEVIYNEKVFVNKLVVNN